MEGDDGWKTQVPAHSRCLVNDNDAAVDVAAVPGTCESGVKNRQAQGTAQAKARRWEPLPRPSRHPLPLGH